MPRARTALAVLVTALVLELNLARAATPPEYKLGDVAESDVVTPVALVVVNPEATEILKKRVAEEVRFVVRYAPQTLAEAEAELRESVRGARLNFLTHVQQADLNRRPSPGSLARSPLLRPRIFRSTNSLPYGSAASRRMRW